MTYERPHIRTMRGYVPGEQPGNASVVKLNTNENPYPPCEAVMAALRETTADMLRRYPSPNADAFRDVAGCVHGVKPENIIATNAGDELLRLAITTFVEPGQPIGIAEPGYTLYNTLAQIHASPVTKVSLAEDWSIPDGFTDRMNDAGVALCMLVNPHAPSGTLTPIERIADIAGALNGVLLLDEAYVDFVDPQYNHDAIDLVRRFYNVLLLRTLSKGYSLAGLRFGYGIGCESIIEPMITKTKDSYNTDAAAQRVAIAALEHRDEARKTWDSVRSERERVRKALASLGLDAPESQTNFLLARSPEAMRLYESLKRRHIYVRYFDQDRLRDRLRITIGTPQQNDALIGALTELVN